MEAAGDDFNPPAPCGAGRQTWGMGEQRAEFQSTRPVRGGTGLQLLHSIFNGFQSTRPVRGGTKTDALDALERLFQSTRPVRGGTAPQRYPHRKAEISIHPPRAGRDKQWGYERIAEIISIHPPRAGRDRVAWSEKVKDIISIHPPRAGRDIDGKYPERFYMDFNPPAPCGAGPEVISISAMLSHFNPPAPCGAGPGCFRFFHASRLFQSTRPVRGGTLLGVSQSDKDKISIHPPRAGRDSIARTP